MTYRSTITAALFLSVLAGLAASQAPPNLSWVTSLRAMAYALGWLMMVVMGIKWIIADSPNERADAKKSMIYIVIGLLIVSSARGLLQLYCDNAIRTLNDPSLLSSATCNPDLYLPP